MLSLSRMVGCRARHVLTLSLLMAAMTPAQGDCVSYYSSAENANLNGIVFTIAPKNYTYIQQYCSSQFPGSMILGSILIMREMAAQCNNTSLVPLGVKRDGAAGAMWAMPPGFPNKTIDMQHGNLGGNGNIGVIDLNTGAWSFVDDSFTFNCAICQQAPRLQLTPAVNPVVVYPNLTLSFIGPPSNNATATQEIIKSELSARMNVAADLMTCQVLEEAADSLQGSCLVLINGTIDQELNDSLTNGVDVKDGDNVYQVALTEDYTLNCVLDVTQQEEGEEVFWPTTPVGTNTITRSFVTFNLMTRECMSDVSRPGHVKYGELMYWQEEWQPCVHKTAADLLPSGQPLTQQARKEAGNAVIDQIIGNLDDLPITARRIEQYAELVNEFVQLQVNDSRSTRSVIELVALVVLSSSLLDPNTSTSVVELSSVVTAVCDIAYSVGFATSTMNFTIIIQNEEKSVIRSRPPTLAATQIILTLPDAFIDVLPRLSLIAVNDSSAVFNTSEKINKKNRKSLLFAMFFTDPSGIEIGNITSLKLSVRKTEESQRWQCYFWNKDGVISDVCKMNEQRGTMLSSCVCSAHDANGYYLLRQTDDYRRHRYAWVLFICVLATIAIVVAVNVVARMGKCKCKRMSCCKKLDKWKERAFGTYTPDEGFVEQEVVEEY